MFVELNGKIYSKTLFTKDGITEDAMGGSLRDLDAEESAKVRELIRKKMAKETIKLSYEVDQLGMEIANAAEVLPKNVSSRMAILRESYIKELYAAAVELDENSTKLDFHLAHVRQVLYSAAVEKGEFVWVPFNIILDQVPELKRKHLKYIVNSPKGKKFIHTRGNMCSSRIQAHDSTETILRPPKVSAVYKAGEMSPKSRKRRCIPKTELTCAW